MEFQIQVWLLKKLLKIVTNVKTRDYIESEISYEADSKKVTIDSTRLTSNELKFLADECREHYAKNVPDKNNKSVHNKFYPFIWLSRKIDQAVALGDSTDPSQKVKSLDLVPIALKTFFRTQPHKIIFKKSGDGWMLPYIITDIDYTPPDRRYKREPYADIEAMAIYRGKETKVRYTWRAARKSCLDLLKEAGFVLPTDELIEGYSSRVSRYRELQPQIGLQVNIVDRAQSGKGWVPMTVDGKPTKAVVDDISDAREADELDQENSPVVHIEYWKDQDIIPLDIFAELVEKYSFSEEDEDEDTKQYTVYPLHPYLKCFDLHKHRFVEAHVANIQDYPWDHNLATKLVLDQETKDLITILVDSTRARREDIISGKMSGTIVLATGVPGVGKTLTAEVFSEKIEKPLYVVQCSQLGISIDTIEKNLQSILDRASRWGAILLIDEADVYIRDRGTDIVHNAIVGVFLRLIEYYNGVLFMTSNRGDIIDDAIISRATAWIRYDIPSPELLTEIWEVLSEQFGVKLGKAEIKTLVSDIPKISGRTVRNLLKLVTALDYESFNDPKANVNYLMNSSKFQKLED